MRGHAQATVEGFSSEDENEEHNAPEPVWTHAELASILATLSVDCPTSATASWSREQLTQAIFNACDRNATGKLSRDELCRFLGSYGHEAEMSELYKFICQELGSSTSAGVDLASFVRLVDGRWKDGPSPAAEEREEHLRAALATRRALASCLNGGNNWVRRLSATRPQDHLLATSNEQCAILLAALGKDEDANESIREVARIAMGQVLDKSSSSAVFALTSLLDTGDWQAQLAVLCALDIVDRRCAMNVVELRRNCFDNLTEKWLPGVAAAAVRQLGELVAPGDQRALAFMIGLQGVPNGPVRAAAIAGIRAAAMPEDEPAIAALEVRLRDESCAVRCEAAKALGRIAGRGDERVVLLLVERLKDAEWCVRCSAARALARVARQGSPAAVAGLLDRLEADDKDYVRHDAVCSIRDLADRGDAVVVAALGARLSREGEETVRATILDVVHELALRGNELAIQAAVTGIRDASAKVRQAAARVLGEISLPGDENTTVLLLEGLEDVDEGVRRATAHALKRIARRGDRRALAALCRSLEDAAPSVRYFAALALGEVMERSEALRIGQRVEIHGKLTHDRLKGKQGTIVRFAEEDGSPIVLVDDGETIAFHQRDVAPVSEGSLAALNKCLKDPHVAVRKVAEVVLYHRRNAADLSVCAGIGKLNQLCQPGRPLLSFRGTETPSMMLGQRHVQVRTPIRRREYDKSPVWWPARPRTRSVFSPSPYVFNPQAFGVPPPTGRRPATAPQGALSGVKGRPPAGRGTPPPLRPRSVQ